MAERSTRSLSILAMLAPMSNSFVLVRLLQFMISSVKLTFLSAVPAGSFAAQGSQTVPSQFASMIPSIAFNVPDLDGVAKLELFAEDDPNQDLACVQSTVGNGKSMNVPAVTYVAAGMAGAALGISALGAVVGGFHVGGASPSPTFGETFGWFQGIATNGMLSVTYPSIYRSFSKNFGFSTGLIPWASMQKTIDNFRAGTGGNLTTDSWNYLQNVTLVDDSTSSNLGNLTKRGVDTMLLYARDFTASVNGSTTAIGNSTSSDNSTSTESRPMHYVHGIQAYVEKLSIPQGNTFMTILLFFAIVIAAITVGILLTKVILEALALMGNLPKSMNSFRKRYWWRLAKTITNLVMLAYGVWTLYCVYQFTNGDSWAAKVLAGITWAIFTGILGFFAFTIWHKANQYKKMDGDASMLFEHKETWVRYAFLYENFKKGYWWLFIPSIVYAFAKNALIAGANGHGLVQTIGQIAIECIMLVLLIWSRPYSLKSGNVINITIQVVRVISVICVLVFVEELGISQTTKTVTGLILIVVQSVLTGVLAILIAVNAIITCVRANPHRQKRKEAGKSEMNGLLMTMTDVLYQKNSTVILTISHLWTLATLCSWTLHNSQSTRVQARKCPNTKRHLLCLLRSTARQRARLHMTLYRRNRMACMQEDQNFRGTRVNRALSLAQPVWVAETEAIVLHRESQDCPTLNSDSLTSAMTIERGICTIVIEHTCFICYSFPLQAIRFFSSVNTAKTYFHVDQFLIMAFQRPLRSVFFNP